jgi:hypothetical protein
VLALKLQLYGGGRNYYASAHNTRDACVQREAIIISWAESVLLNKFVKRCRYQKGFYGAGGWTPLVI